MTQKKKRGLLSWLGFGEEEQTKANQETIEEGAVVEGQEEEALEPRQMKSLRSSSRSRKLP